MLINKKHFFITSYLLVLSLIGFTQQPKPIDLIETTFRNPPESAKPWVFWYWLHGAVSKKGITADLEAMKQVGIGGAYLMPIKDTSFSIPFQPQVRQLTPEWWSMVKFAMQEAKRLKLQLGIHVSDGFALAGGPWITPELSMQKLVWTKAYIKNGFTEKINLEQPASSDSYYRDIAVFAYPANSSYAFNDVVLVPTVTASNGAKPQFLSFDGPDNREIFRSDSNCWIQYKYPEPFTCRSIRIHEGTNNYQAQRFIIQKSDDGINFTSVDTLQPPRHGWQDWDLPYTHAVKTFTAKYIRFVWTKEGTEPGSEDLDAAKWRPVLRVRGIYLSDEPVLNNYEAKNGSVWRVAANTTTNEVSKQDAVPLKSIIDLTGKLDREGSLNWTPPAGNWIITRIGHTSTGAVNSTGGGGKGLECDKFSTEATTLQFNNWFGKFYTKTDPSLAKQVIKIFHVDSWECGSQNWSRNFAAEFKKRRGYDLLRYLLVMTGTPVDDAATSEKVLHDVRETIAELVNDKFYLTLKNLAHAKGVLFSAESIAPTFVSDGLMHYKHVDIPMGEFWLNSPTHDKPNDMLDAISGAHIYGKNIVQAEAFTTLRSDWGEHPGNLKSLGDRAFASGINKLSLHVFMHNPWLDKKPGMTLDGIGLFYQRDQTWFKQSKAWIEYLTRCQALLQLGKPVVDIAVFTGEEIPRRSILPDRLVNTLPGIFGKEKVEAEKKRLHNEGQPMRTIPDGVTHSANMADPENYIDALNGYSYDCFNPDVLLQMKVVNRKAVAPGGTSYKALVIPGKHPMNPNSIFSDRVINKLIQLKQEGAKVFMADPAYANFFTIREDTLQGMPVRNQFSAVRLSGDLIIENNDYQIQWVHRKYPNIDIYFLSNQSPNPLATTISFSVGYKKIELWDPVTVKMKYLVRYPNHLDKTTAVIKFEPFQSYFVIFREELDDKPLPKKDPSTVSVKLGGSWELKYMDQTKKIKSFNTSTLTSWTSSPDTILKYYSGTVSYKNSFTLNQELKGKEIFIKFDSIYNLATVKVNGIDCGTVWTQPYELEISKAVKPGENKIEIEVTNTWRNRLILDEQLPPEKRITYFNSPYKLKDKPLLPAGIVGEVKIIIR